jgi:L-threonylcarbamoyladenylate synthase
VCAICDALGGAIVSTSANPTGKPPAQNELRLRQYFPEGIDFIVSGKVGGDGKPSQIRDLATGKVLRAGGNA